MTKDLHEAPDRLQIQRDDKKKRIDSHRQSVLIRVFAVIVAMLLLAPHVSASQSTPVTVEVDACTVTPRTTAELQELYDRALVLLEGPALGTPLASPQLWFVADKVAPDAGEPADAETAAAAIEAASQFFSCSDARDLPAITATLTERQAVGFLSLQVVVISAFEKVPLDTFIAENGSGSFEQFLESWQVAGAELAELAPANSEPPTYEVQSVRALDDGRVLVSLFVVLGDDATPEAAPNRFNSFPLVLIPEGDKYLIELDLGAEAQ